MYWNVRQRDLIFDFIASFLKERNSKHTALIKVTFYILDESMSGWYPKTSKTGGFPHISHEHRKSVPLEIMITNVVECLTKIYAQG